MNEQQYYMPIVQAMIATQQRQQQSEQLKAENAWHQQQTKIQEAQLDQASKRMDIEKDLRDAEVEHLHSLMANEADVTHARQTAEIQHNILNGMNPATIGQNAPLQNASGTGPLGQGAVVPSPNYDPTKPAPTAFVGVQQVPISQLPSQEDMLHSLALQNQAKEKNYKLPDWAQKDYGMPAEGDDKMLDAAIRLREAHANLITNLAAKEKMLSETNDLKKYQIDQTTEMRRDFARMMAAARGGSKEDAANQRSYQFHLGQIQKESVPIDTMVGRFSRLQDSLNQNTPIGDSMIAPELLSISAGGQGSGLRMTQPEINAIVGGRNNYEALQAWAQKWTTDPSKGSVLTPNQRQQIRALAGAMGQKLQQKQQIINDSRQLFTGANDPATHRQIFADMQNKLSAVDTPKPITFKSPSGATRSFTDPAQIETFRKTPGFTEVQQ